MRRRILISMVVVTAIAVVLFATPLAFALRDLHHEEEVVRLERTAAEASEDVPTNFPKTSARISVRTVQGREIGLYGRDGRLVAGRGPKMADSIIRTALGGGVRDLQVGNRIVVAIPVTRGERIVGALRASVSDRAVNSRTRGTILVMIAIGMLAVAVSALIALVQSRRLADPVGRLADVATRLGDGDFTVQSEHSGVPEVDAVSVALETTAARLDHMLSRERAFSADASHQLRTPLTSLRVTLEATRLDPRADRDAALDTALGDVDRLERTIDDLLALAREPRLQRTATDLAVVVAESEADWARRVQPAHRPLRVMVEPDLPPVAISDRAVRQILEVLVDNALRHGAGAVSIHVRPVGSGAVLEVSDEGRGVTGDADRIFDRRTSNAGSHGIGLALARSLAEAEGARLVLRRASPGPVFSLVMSAATTAAAEPS